MKTALFMWFGCFRIAVKKMYFTDLVSQNRRSVSQSSAELQLFPPHLSFFRDFFAVLT